jgi:transcriptional regulator with XRE-family HTH domain
MLRPGNRRRVKIDRDLAKFGRAVRAARQARHLSQEELADLSGLHRNYVGGIERGERNVGIKALFRISKAFGVHPDDLLADCTFDWGNKR